MSDFPQVLAFIRTVVELENRCATETWKTLPQTGKQVSRCLIALGDLLSLTYTVNRAIYKGKDMARGQSKSLPSTKSLNELVEFFDTHDMGEYWDQMPKVHLDVNIKRRTHLVAIDKELFGKLTEIAKSKKVSTKTLIDSWLKKKILKAG